MKASYFCVFVLLSFSQIKCRTSQPSSSILSSLADAVPLVAPENLTANKYRDGTIEISWSPVNGATSYNLSISVGDKSIPGSDRVVERLMRPRHIILKPRVDQVYQVRAWAVGRAGSGPKSALHKFTAEAPTIQRISKDHVFIAEMNVSTNGQTISFVERQCAPDKACVQVLTYDSAAQQWNDATTIFSQAITGKPYLSVRLNHDGSVIYVTSADGVLRFSRVIESGQTVWRSKKVSNLNDIDAIALVTNDSKRHFLVRDRALYLAVADQDEIWGEAVNIGRGANVSASIDGSTLISERSGVRAWTLTSGSWNEILVGVAVAARMSEAGDLIVGYDAQDALVSYQLGTGQQWSGGPSKKSNCCYRYIALSADGVYAASGNAILKRSGVNWSVMSTFKVELDAAQFVGNSSAFFAVANNSIVYLAEGASEFKIIY